MAWYNSDGLLVKIGPEEATPSIGGEPTNYGDNRLIEAILDLTTVAAADTIIDDNLWIPKNATIEEVEVETVTGATAAGAATLDIGLIRSDRSTLISATAIVASTAKTTIDTAGKRLNLITGSTAAGAQIGVKQSYNGLFTAKVNTGPFTAGLVRIRIKLFF